MCVPFCLYDGAKGKRRLTSFSSHPLTLSLLVLHMNVVYSIASKRLPVSRPRLLRSPKFDPSPKSQVPSPSIHPKFIISVGPAFLRFSVFTFLLSSSRLPFVYENTRAYSLNHRRSTRVVYHDNVVAFL